MPRLVTPPEPTEEKLLKIIARDVTFPNGRAMRVAISQWHWEMLDFIAIWDAYYRREAGMLYEFCKQKPNITSERFSNAVMSILRKDYNDWRADTPPGEPITFEAPGA